jgi:hypothetical protein
MTRAERGAIEGQRKANARYWRAIAARNEVASRPHWCGRDYAKANAVVQRASVIADAALEKVMRVVGS